jgi:hypothetical protein
VSSASVCLPRMTASSRVSGSAGARRAMAGAAAALTRAPGWDW